MNYRKEFIMSKKLREISGLTPEHILLITEETNYPVNIEKILNYFSIKYGPMDFSEIEQAMPNTVKARGEILGAVTVLDEDICIFYSKKSLSESQNRVRFTLAHELAHCCLDAESLQNNGHIEFRFDVASDEYHEKAANIFAGKLLVPEKPLKNLYDNMIIPASNSLAQEFKVSVQVMEARLKFLELPFYSLNGG